MNPIQETYSEWQLAWEHYNKTLFGGELRPCMITLKEEKNTLGYFSYNHFVRRTGEQSDEIALNPAYFATMPVEKVLSTLVHEMVHLWQFNFHFKDERSTRYHNKTWSLKMESLGLCPSDTGKPGGRKTGQKMSDYIVKGGRFEEQTKILLKKGFLLTWLGRYIQVRNHTYEIKDYPEFELNRENYIKALSLNKELISTIAPDANKIVSTRHKKNSKRPTRTKFKCSCGDLAWGKSGLRMICEKCEERFLPVTESR